MLLMIPDHGRWSLTWPSPPPCPILSIIARARETIWVLNCNSSRNWLHQQNNFFQINSTFAIFKFRISEFHFSNPRLISPLWVSAWRERWGCCVARVEPWQGFRSKYIHREISISITINITTTITITTTHHYHHHHPPPPSPSPSITITITITSILIARIVTHHMPEGEISSSHLWEEFRFHLHLTESFLFCI